MSVNLGSEAVTAIKELRGNPHFERFLDAYEVFAQNMMISSLDADVTTRVDKSAYARGFLHTWQAMHSAFRETHVSQSKMTAPSKRVGVNV